MLVHRCPFLLLGCFVTVAANDLVGIDSQQDTKNSVGGFVAFCSEKGFHCKGGMQFGKGGCVMCEGGLKSEFHPTCKASDLVEHIAANLKGQLQDMITPTAGTSISELDALFYPTEEDMEMMTMYQDESTLENIEEGFEKSFEFGGHMMAEWGCKVTYSVKGGKFTKQSECGMKVRKAMGKKPGESDLVEMEW